MLLNRSIAPDFKSLQDFVSPKAKEITLANGVKMFLINTGKSEVVNLQLVYKAGKVYEQDQCIADTTLKLLKEGTTKHSAKEINEIIDQYGAEISSFTGLRTATIELFSMKKFLSPLCDLLLELINEAQFPEKEVKYFFDRTIQTLKVNQQKTKFKAMNHFKERLLGENHPFGYTMSEKKIENIKIDQLKAHYKRLVVGKKFDLIVAGNIDDKCRDFLTNTFGQLKVEEPILNEKYTAFDTTDTPIYLKIDDSIQTSIRIGKKTIGRTHPDHIKLQLCNTIFGGYFGSRLMQNIREDKGYTYGIYSSISSWKEEGFLVIGTDVKKEFHKEAVKEIYKEIDILKNTLIEEEELETVKNYMAGSYLKSVTTLFGLSEQFRRTHYNALPKDYYDTFISSIRNTTAKEIQEIAHKYYNNDFIEVLVG